MAKLLILRTNMLKINDNLFVPSDFEKNHNYYADEKGEKPYTGVTTILGVISKNAIIQWASNEACKRVKELWIADKAYPQGLIDAAL